MKKLVVKLIGAWINFLAYVSPRKAGELGFYLFSSPQRTAMKGHQNAFLDTSEKSSFLHDGYRIQVYRWGNGKKKILFLHGWQSHSFRWKNYIEAFDQNEFTLYAFDAPGHGNSGGKYLNLPIYGVVLETVLNLVGPFDAIVGHSLGSFAAVYTFYKTGVVPVERLVLTGTPGEANEFFGFYKQTLGLSNHAESIIRKAFVRILGQEPGYYSARRFATVLNIPGLIIHDMGDLEAPIHHAESIHRVWKEADLVATSGLGHNLRSPEVVSRIKHFLTPSKPTHQRVLPPEFEALSMN